MSDFGEDGFGRCRGCGEWTRHESPKMPGMARCVACGPQWQGKPDSLHGALASVVNEQHWRAFCDAWLAIGLAAVAVDDRECFMGISSKAAIESISGKIGRVVRRGPFELRALLDEAEPEALP